jgi:cytidine deaminase
MDSLVATAREAVDAAYAPYSEYRVGAALRTVDGVVFTGCNVENANYSNSLHAEEVALGSAVRAGHRAFAALAVSTAAPDGVLPCGMCRQSLAEFCGDDFPVLADEGEESAEYRLGTLIPDAIAGADLEG